MYIAIAYFVFSYSTLKTGNTHTHIHARARDTLLLYFFCSNIVLHVHTFFSYKTLVWMFQYSKCVHYIYFFVFHYIIMLYCNLRLVFQELHKRTMAIKGVRHRLFIPYTISCGGRGGIMFWHVWSLVLFIICQPNST